LETDPAFQVGCQAVPEWAHATQEPFNSVVNTIVIPTTHVNQMQHTGVSLPYICHDIDAPCILAKVVDGTVTVLARDPVAHPGQIVNHLTTEKCFDNVFNYLNFMRFRNGKAPFMWSEMAHFLARTIARVTWTTKILNSNDTFEDINTDDVLTEAIRKEIRASAWFTDANGSLNDVAYSYFASCEQPDYFAPTQNPMNVVEAPHAGMTDKHNDVQVLL